MFQARHDAAIATLKLLLENSSHELRNAQINSRQLFDNKIKEVAKSNYEAQQQRFLASSSTNTNIQQLQKSAYSATGLFKKPNSQANLTDLKRASCTGLQFNLSPSHPVQGWLFLRGVVTQSSSPPLNMPLLSQSSESQPFPLPILSRPDIPVGGRLAHFVEKWGEFTQHKWVLSIQFNFPSFDSSDKSESVFLPVITRRDNGTSPETDSGKGTRSVFSSRLFLVPKKNGRLHPAIDVSLLNQYIRKQPFKMKTVKSV